MWWRYEIRNRLGTVLELADNLGEAMMLVRAMNRAHPLGIHTYDKATHNEYR